MEKKMEKDNENDKIKELMITFRDVLYPKIIQELFIMYFQIYWNLKVNIYLILI